MLVAQHLRSWQNLRPPQMAGSKIPITHTPTDSNAGSHAFYVSDDEVNNNDELGNNQSDAAFVKVLLPKIQTIRPDYLF